MPQVELTELTRAELEDALSAEGLERYRARQIFHWVYRRGVTDFAAMTDLPGPRREACCRRARRAPGPAKPL